MPIVVYPDYASATAAFALSGNTSRSANLPNGCADIDNPKTAYFVAYPSGESYIFVDNIGVCKPDVATNSLDIVGNGSNLTIDNNSQTKIKLLSRLFACAGQVSVNYIPIPLGTAAGALAIPPNNNRISLMIGSGGMSGGIVLNTNQADALTAAGIPVVAQNVAPVILNYDSVGPLVQQGWYISTLVAGNPIAVWETVLNY